MKKHQKSNTGIKLALPTQGQDEFLSKLWRAFWLALFVIGLTFLVFSVVESSKLERVISYIITFLLPFLMVLTLKKEQSSWLFYALPSTILLVLVVGFYKNIANYFLYLYNGWAEALGRRWGRILPLLAAESVSQVDAVIFRLFFLTLLIFILLSAKKHLQITLVIIFSIIVVFASIMANTVNFAALCFLLFALVAIVLSNLRADKKQVPLRVYWLRIISVLLILLLFFLLTPLRKKDRPIDALVNAQNSVKYLVKRLRYGSDPVLPEGDFRRIKNFDPQEEDVLEVVMSEPDSYYLRGFVGSVYDLDSWKELKAESLYEAADKFYWLHENDFYGQTQMSQAALTVFPKIEKNKMTVRNLHGSTAYVYAPYEVVSAKENLQSKDYLGDEAFMSRGFSGSNIYTFALLPNQVREYTKTLSHLSDGLENANVECKSYLDLEALYNSFVYDNYLDIPDSTLETLTFLLGERDSNSSPDYGRVKQAILSYLTEYFDYSEEANEFSSDFVIDFMQNSRQGYSVHFASAATLMFRYFGIPARYVEGYLITPADVANTLANSAVRIDEKHAHAWTEFYQDGVGWIPFETTPPYLDIMESAEDMRGVADDDSTKAEQPNLPDDSEKEDAEQNPDSGRYIMRQRVKKILLIIAIVILSILVILLLIMIIRCLILRRRLRKFRNSLSSDKSARTALNIFSYAVKLLLATDLIKSTNDIYAREKMGEEDVCGRAYGEQMNTALDIYEKIRFGNSSATEADFIQLKEWLQNTEYLVQEQRSRGQRFLDRFVRVIYL